MNQMSLFGGNTSLAPETLRCVAVTPRYTYEKVKVNDKWVVVVKDGQKVIKTSADGRKMVSADVISLPPRKSDKGPSLEKITGLVGKALELYEIDTRKAMGVEAVNELVRLVSNGQYAFGREIRNRVNGAITLTLKPVFGGKSVTTTDTSELIAELARRGVKVEIETGTPAPEAPKVENPQGSLSLNDPQVPANTEPKKRGKK